MIKNLILYFFVFFISSTRAESDHNNGAFVKDLRTQCKVYSPNPDQNAKEIIHWSGDCKDGFATGFGTVEWYQGAQLFQRWTGFFVEGQRRRHRIDLLTANDDQLQSYEGNFPLYSNGIVRVVYKNLIMLADYDNGKIGTSWRG